MSKKWRQWASIARAGLISGVLGTNLAALFLLRHPSRALACIQYNLFGWRFIARRGLPIRQLHQELTIPEVTSISLLPTTDHLTWWDANYAKDMMYLWPCWSGRRQ